MVGIPDDASDATSLNETVVFANQAGVELTLGNAYVSGTG